MNSVPQEIKKWNWGAFMFNMMWGFGNKCYLPLLCLVPLLNLVWIFVCGFKGNEWAWKNGQYTDVETFLAVQDTWSRAGLVMFVINIVFTVVYFLFLGTVISSLLMY